MKVFQKIVLEISFKAWQSIKKLWKCRQINKSIYIHFFSIYINLYSCYINSLHYCSLFLTVNYFSLHSGIFFKGKTFSQAQLILWWSKGSFIFNFQLGNIRYSEEAPLFEDSIKSFNKYHILDTSFLGLKTKTWASYQSKLKGKNIIFTHHKVAEKEHKDNKENNFSQFLGSNGWKQERATKRSEIARVDELSKLTNGVVFVFGCVCV